MEARKTEIKSKICDNLARFLAETFPEEEVKSITYRTNNETHEEFADSPLAIVCDVIRSMF